MALGAASKTCYFLMSEAGLAFCAYMSGETSAYSLKSKAHKVSTPNL